MKIWQCPFDGAYIEAGKKCPECHITQEKALEIDAERDRQQDNAEEVAWLKLEENPYNI